MSKRVKLPAGKIGVFFGGSPPRIDQVNADSPLANQVRVGQYVTTLILHDLELTNVPSAEKLVELLIKYAGTERYLIVQDVPPVGATTYSVVIPTGKLGITFQGHTPTTIIKVNATSPIAHICKVGQIFERLLIPGKPPMEGQVTSAQEFVQALGANSTVKGRTLLFSDPGTGRVIPTPVALMSTPVVAPVRVQAQRAGDLMARLEGSETQVIHITMNPGQKVLAEPGTMIYMSDGVEMNTGTGGGGGFGRWMTGSKVFMTEFVYFGQRQGTVCFGPKFPSKVVPLRLEDYGGKIICQRGSYLCSGDSVSIAVEFAGSLGTAFFGGEGFILQGIAGSGQVFLDGSGTIITKKLAPGERLRVSTGALMAFENSVRYDIQTVGGGIGNVLFGGQGLFLTTLTGPGTVWLEGAPIDNIVKEIASRLPKN